MTTLAATIEEEDERRFVGRSQELELVADVLAGRSPAHILVVHGPGGIGKSTLLRQIRRQAERAGWDIRAVDGRDGVPTTSELEEHLAGGATEHGRLIILDTYERMASLGPQLRGTVLPTLPDNSLVVIAQRGAPESGWLQGGWERVTRTLPLAPVTGDEARDLLIRDGVTDPEVTDSLLAWAGGSPLALTLGAESVRDQGDWGVRGLDDHLELADVLVRRLTEAELDASHLDVITVAAIARRTDAAMLSDVLPGVDGDQADAWLRSRTFTEPLGRWVTLHDLVRGAFLAQLRSDSPERVRELHRRITEHLYQRACAGETGLITNFAELVENQAIRFAIPGEGPPGLRADDARVEELELTQELINHRGIGEWWTATTALIRNYPRCVSVARNDRNEIAGLCIAVAARDAPPVAEKDPILGGWLAHARVHVPDGNALLWRDSLDLTDLHGMSDSPVLPVVNTAALLRSGLANPRWSYLPIDPGNAAAADFARTIGAVHLPDLDVVFDGRTQQCHLLDHGVGGMLGTHRTTVYLELGLTPPPPDAGAEAGASTAITADTVKEALRTLDRPLELARSPLAQGQTVTERAATVRDLVTSATSEAFGTTQAERLLHDVIVERYLSAPTTHERTAELLHVSRSTYFRHLGVAVDRVATFALLARGIDPATANGD
jgi:AAA ATPase domain